MATPHLKNQLALLQHQNQLLKHILSFKQPTHEAGSLKSSAGAPTTPTTTLDPPSRHQAAMSLLETAAAQQKLLQQIADREKHSRKPSESEAPPPLPCFSGAAHAIAEVVSTIAPPPGVSLTAAATVRMRHQSTPNQSSSNDASTNFHRIPVVASRAQQKQLSYLNPAQACKRSSLSPPRRGPKGLPRMPAMQPQPEAPRECNTKPMINCSTEDGESLPGSPYWTQAMNIADMPDGETSEYKDEEMRRMLKSWLLPRRTTQWCGNGQSCTLEQKVAQKRSRMGQGRTPMFMMHCG
eukprot:TRINITY_DN1244_c0_g1_i1.p1 TRINITY_DN1244_c0_g1~~TRINITY_DN1244_c0_g1_i1.p1  ORF type:complete len:295 (-),score=30.33 TRINITY_DN1244_c0_g1_i1:185-1069(-)